MKNACLPEVEATMEALFRRLPALCGFSVQEMRALPSDEREVVFAEVAIQPWAGCRPSQELLSELADALLDLVDERPEASELLAGRTFAPVIH